MRYIPNEVKQAVEAMVGLPWSRLVWVGQGSYADAFALPAPWSAVVRIAFERHYNNAWKPVQTDEIAQKLQLHNFRGRKYLPEVYASQIVRVVNDVYSIVLMKKYKPLTGDPLALWEGNTWEKVCEEFDSAGIPRSDDVHRRNVGIDDDGTVVFFDVW